jgi:hypothetical protein
MAETSADIMPARRGVNRRDPATRCAPAVGAIGALCFRPGQERPMQENSMTIEKLRQAIRVVDFKPFTIRVADGRSFDVPNPEFVAVSPGQRTVVVLNARGDMSVLDALLITEIEFKPPAAASA